MLYRVFLFFSTIFFLNTAHGYIYITNIHVFSFFLMGALSKPKARREMEKEGMKEKFSKRKTKQRTNKSLSCRTKDRVLHYSFLPAPSYRQKLEKAQLVVIRKITHSLRLTLRFFSFTRSSKHAAFFQRKKMLQGQPMR
uniref:Putative secreted protein n=1 Tax=Amblyomma triste TaxID=251400 RepID=A0A023G280_AMBTT